MTFHLIIDLISFTHDGPDGKSEIIQAIITN